LGRYRKKEGVKAMFDAENNECGIITKDSTATAKELSVIFGLTTRRIRQLAEDEVIVREDRGRYNLADSVQGYAAFIAKPEEAADDLKMEKDRRRAELTLKEAKAKVAMLHAKELEGEMHRAEDVQLFTQGLIDMIKSALISLPGRCAVELSRCEEAEECQIILKDTVREILREISEFDYDPVRYEELVRKRENMNEMNYDDE
jgi:phage terminase Nu1 subunit (DNA packaging protein)